MGSYQSAYWLSDSWGAPSGAYHPYLPDKLAEKDISLSAETAAAVSWAEGEIVALNSRSGALTNTEPLARLILRSEALASSRIEGIETPAARLLELEVLDSMGVSHRPDSTEAAVLANIRSMHEGIVSVAGEGELSVAALCTINRGLLQGTRLEEYGGVVRTTQNWVGGNDVNPVGAAYVPPAPEHVGAYLEDLVRFCNSSPLPPLAVAAVAHAQLETIHPFADGNGRTGRALVHAILRMRGLAPSVVPPVSLVLATDKARYIDHLERYRVDDAQLGSPSFDEALDGWVRYFSRAASVACERAGAFEERMGHIQEAWREAVRPRKGSAADLLLGVLPGNPVVSVSTAARLIGRSYEAARLAIARLQERGVLYQNARNRKSSLYVARAAVDAFTAYERALSVPGGDTAVEKPARPVVQRPPDVRR